MTGLRIVIDIYSGRPNPVVEIGPDEAAAVLELLQPAGELPAEEDVQTLGRILGYRGLVIDQLGPPIDERPQTFRVAAGRLVGAGLRHHCAVDDAEERLLATDGAVGRRLDPAFRAAVVTGLGRLRTVDWSTPRGAAPVSAPSPCPGAPDQDLDWWNDLAWSGVSACSGQKKPGWSRQCSNNCYNYATNQRTDSFAQPGQASGRRFSSTSPDAVRLAAWYDNLYDAPGANNACAVQGHLVYLAVTAPGDGDDYHWWRKGSTGFWSHKPGTFPATAYDSSNQPIADPRESNNGVYTVAAGFMVVVPGHVRVA